MSGHTLEATLRSWDQQVPELTNNPGHQRLRRPGPVQPVSVALAALQKNPQEDRSRNGPSSIVMAASLRDICPPGKGVGARNPTGLRQAATRGEISRAVTISCRLDMI